MSKDSRLKIAPIAVSVALSFSAAGTVTAQDAGFSLEEIVVTARKVEESIQDVPLSISAFSSADISDRAIEELDDIAMLTPGLTYEDYSNGAYGAPIIRGASQNSISQLEQNVSTFLDGVYIPRQYAIDIGTVGLERIEVVKGPQSALYGANAFMGAINYVSSKADLDEFGADISVTLGTDERRDLSASVNVPVLPGVLAFQAGLATSEFDGDWDNTHPAADQGGLGTNGNLGGWDKDSYFLDISAQPSDDLSIELGYKKFKVINESRPQSRLSQSGGDLNCGDDSISLFGGFFVIDGERAYCGELPGTPLVPGEDTAADFYLDPRSIGLVSDSEFLRANIAYDLTEEMTLTYNYGNMKGDVYAAGIADRDPVRGQISGFTGLPDGTSAFSSLPFGDFEYSSHEIRLETTTDSGVYWMFGAYMAEVEDTEITLGQGGGVIFPVYQDGDVLQALTRQSIIDGATAVATNITTVDTNAYFGRVSIPMMDDKLVFSAEARYTDEEKDVDTLTESYTESYVTPRISLDYSLGEDSIVYVSAAQGAKSGGINTSNVALTDAELQYGIDENTTFELGSKNVFLDGNLQLNAAIYQIDWADLQISTSPENGTDASQTIIQNIGAAESTGLELDLAYIVGGGITLRAGFAMHDATYDQGTISQRLVRAEICDDVVCAANGDVSGNDLPRTSDTQWNVGARYDGIISDLNFYLSTDIAGQSEQFVSEINLATIPSRTLVNLNAGLSSADGTWSAELWVKNAADKEYVANAFYINSPFFIDYVPTWGAKRRVGLTLDYSF